MLIQKLESLKLCVEEIHHLEQLRESMFSKDTILKLENGKKAKKFRLYKEFLDDLIVERKQLENEINELLAKHASLLKLTDDEIEVIRRYYFTCDKWEIAIEGTDLLPETDDFEEVDDSAEMWDKYEADIKRKVNTIKKRIQRKLYPFPAIKQNDF